jgi:site-specific recombinase XerD
MSSNLYWEIMKYHLEQTAESKVFNISLRRARNIVYSSAETYLRKRIRLHVIRHSYAVAVLKATKNLEFVRRFLGCKEYAAI